VVLPVCGFPWGAVGAVGGAAGVGGGETTMLRRKEMRSSVTHVVGWKNFLAVLVAAMCCTPGVLSLAGCDSKEKAPDAVQVAQEGFATPEAAAAALVQAAGNYDVPALMRILGPDGHILVTSEDAVGDKNGSLAFAAAARDKQSVAIDPEDANRATLVVGKDDWPLPIPIVKREGKWYFDSKAGIEEVLHRRIGANELNAIQVCRGYVEAQHEYASVQHDGSGLNQYAQRVVSTPGKHDGLAWQNPDGSWGGPVGEGVARLLQEGYTDKSEPFHGYYFKFLKGQGPAAPLGEMN